MKKIGYLTLLAAAVLGLLWACSSNETEQGQTPRIDQIIPTSGDAGIEIKIEGFQFGDNPTAHIGFREMEVLSSSDNEIIAKVPQTAITGPITVTSNELRGVGEVFTVNDPPQEDIIGLDCASKSTLYSHKKYALTIGAITYPGDETIAWSSDDEEVATVDNGVVTPVAPGEATITASFGTDTATCSITVVDGPVTSLTVTPTEVQLYRGETAQLTISDIIVEEGYSLADLEDATFTSANEDVATVDNNGLITAIAPGETMVSVILENKNVEVPVAVNTSVYIVGYTYEEELDTYDAKLWENGNEKTLACQSTNCVGNDVVVGENGNVYVVGEDEDYAVLWTNDQPEVINGDIDKQAEAKDILLYENDIYIAGTEQGNNKYVPNYWVNEELYQLPENLIHNVGEAIAVNGEDIYLCGISVPNVNNAMLWHINGQGEVASLNLNQNTLKHGGANGVVFKNGKTLVVGHEINDNNIRTARLWEVDENFEATYTVLNDNLNSDARAYDIILSANTGYVVGYEMNLDNINIAKLWTIGGESKELSTQKSQAYGIFISQDGFIYVAGVDYNAQLNINVPTYWKIDQEGNIETFHLSDMEGEAYAIFVK